MARIEAVQQRRSNNVAEPSSSVGGYLAWKLWGVILGAGAIAGALGFLLLWPKTLREAFARLAAAIAGSALLGPFVVVGFYAWQPTFFLAGQNLAKLLGLPEWAGLLPVSAPFLVLGGLPFWYILGGIMRWLEARKDKDIVEIVKDAEGAVKP